MVPKKLQSYFNITREREERDNKLIEGTLTCCNSHNFEIFVTGEIKYNIFPKMCLLPEDDRIILKVRCKKCGKIILVFDSSCDGYEHCEKNQFTHTLTKTANCKKCKGDNFFVDIKYEYPDVQELEKLGIVEIDNAFTWIWVTLGCNKCGTRYKNFIDCETS